MDKENIAEIHADHDSVILSFISPIASKRNQFALLSEEL
jgi:hypothetical protein